MKIKIIIAVVLVAVFLGCGNNSDWKIGYKKIDIKRQAATDSLYYYAAQSDVYFHEGLKNATTEKYNTFIMFVNKRDSVLKHYFRMKDSVSLYSKKCTQYLDSVEIEKQ